LELTGLVVGDVEQKKREYLLVAATAHTTTDATSFTTFSTATTTTKTRSTTIISTAPTSTIKTKV